MFDLFSLNWLSLVISFVVSNALPTLPLYLSLSTSGTLGKTIGALANKTIASTMSEGKGMTTSGGTYIPQSYASTYKDRQMFTNVCC